MGFSRSALTALLAIASVAAGCATGGAVKEMTGSTSGSTSTGAGSGGSASACVPGEQISCGCVGGGFGAQICSPDGASFGTCYGCDPVSGAGGAGGAPTSSTSSGATTTTGATTGATTSTTTSAASSGGGGAPAACPVGPTGVDLSGMTLYSNPPDLASWPVTTTLTEVDFTNDGVHVEFSKVDGADRWPDVIPPGWGGPLQYTIGMAECIDGQWYASAVIEVWYGLPAAGGNVAQSDQIAANWYYDANRWGLLAGRQPATGETIGIFVAAGNLRNITADDPAQSPVMERSNVVLVPMPDVTGATHAF